MTWEEFWIFVTQHRIITGFEDWEDTATIMEKVLFVLSYFTTPLGLLVLLIIYTLLRWYRNTH